jgi:hypothetical protein
MMKTGTYFRKYTVYDNRTDFPVIVDGNARECAEAMRLTLNSFYCAVNRARSGVIKRWTITSRFITSKERGRK